MQVVGRSKGKRCADALRHSDILQEAYEELAAVLVESQRELEEVNEKWKAAEEKNSVLASELMQCRSLLNEANEKVGSLQKRCSESEEKASHLLKENTTLHLKLREMEEASRGIAERRQRDIYALPMVDNSALERRIKELEKTNEELRYDLSRRWRLLRSDHMSYA